jgi:probable HAF family extracellular repeat protein
LTGGYTVPTDIGRFGEIVGWSETSPNSYDHYEHAFRWTPHDGMVDLHRRDVNLGFRSWASAINASGLIAGSVSGSQWFNSAALFTAQPPAPMEMVKFDSAPCPTLFPFDVNDDARLVGYCENYPHVPFLWSAQEGLVILPHDTGLYSRTEARAINNHGVVAGIWESSYLGLTYHALRWADGVVTDLGTLGGVGAAAYGINDDGVIVGNASTASGARHAFRWTADTGMQDLGTLGGGSSRARAINQHGTIVGESVDAGGHTVGFVWSAATGMASIGPYLPVAINEMNQVAAMRGGHAYLLQIRRVSPPSEILADGHPDLIWSDDSGALAVWSMNGRMLHDGAMLSLTVPADWRIAAAADMDLDGHCDLILQRTDGAVAAWLMNGLTIRDGVFLAPQTDSAWRVVSAGDVDGDRYPDLMWQHTDGSLAVWLMTATTLRDGFMLSPRRAGTPPMRVVGSGDLNGDGAPDLLLRGEDGTLAAWFLCGPTLCDGAIIAGPGTAAG